MENSYPARLKCFKYKLFEGRSPSATLPEGNACGYGDVEDWMYGVARVVDLSVIADWQAEEITLEQLKTAGFGQAWKAANHIYKSKLSIIEKLEELNKLGAVLTLFDTNPTSQLKWDAAVEISWDDEEIRNMLTFLEVDPDEVLS
jgi:hypothetical protein